MVSSNDSSSSEDSFAYVMQAVTEEACGDLVSLRTGDYLRVWLRKGPWRNVRVLGSDRVLTEATGWVPVEVDGRRWQFLFRAGEPGEALVLADGPVSAFSVAVRVRTAPRMSVFPPRSRFVAIDVALDSPA